MKYQRIYKQLVQYGHSPMGALGIIIDARRGNRLALQWIKQVCGVCHGT